MTKRILLALLAVLMCISMCSCGGGESTETESKPAHSSSVASETSKENSKSDTLEIDDLEGTWKTSIWFFNSSVQINSNTTYTYGRENGTVKIFDNNTFRLTDRSGMYNTDFGVANGYIYEKGHSFKKDLEFGLVFSPDANGKTDQTFNYTILNVSTIDTSYSANSIELDLNTDGTFKITTGIRSYSSFSKKDEFAGTYSYTNSILTLKYNGKNYPLIVEDGVIYFHVFKK